MDILEAIAVIKAAVREEAASAYPDTLLCDRGSQAIAQLEEAAAILEVCSGLPVNGNPYKALSAINDLY